MNGLTTTSALTVLQRTDTAMPRKAETERFMITSHDERLKEHRIGGFLRPTGGIGSRTNGEKAVIVHTFS
jgi:hypothetical protein